MDVISSRFRKVLDSASAHNLMRLGPQSPAIRLDEFTVRMISCGWVHNLLELV